MNTSDKIVSFADAAALLDGLRAAGRRIVHCHGTFDLIHPGHIYYLEEAKALGDVLIVTVRQEEFVEKGPDRPFFNDQLRLKVLSALECVDHVVAVPTAAAADAIRTVRPDVFCKSKKYESLDRDPSANTGEDVAATESVGGEVRYIGSETFASAHLIKQHFEAQNGGVKEFCERLANAWPIERIRAEVERFAKLKVLIIGDLIFDRYSQAVVQGLTSKNKTLSARHVETETQAGGSLAVYRHIRQFTENVRLISLVGTEPWVDTEVARYLDPDADRLIRSENFTTVVKHRFIEIQGREKEVGKLFSINYLDNALPDEAAQLRVRETVEREIECADLVLVMDFGHGLMTDPLRRLVEKRAGFMALNCQTNSFNYGFNIINRRYRRADVLTLDTAEVSLALGERSFDARDALGEMVRFFGSRYGFFTRGESPSIGIVGDSVVECPAFESVVTDTVGAGDAFCSLASLAAANGLPADVTMFLGQLAGALAVKIVGNRTSIRKDTFLAVANNLLSY